MIAAALLLAVLPAPPATAAFDVDGQGFVQARAEPRQSITVEEPRTDVGFPIADAIAPWNELAGWELFVVSDAEVTDVRVWPNWPADDPSPAAVYVTPDSDGAFLRCEIRYDPTDQLDANLFAHELGHCLGLVDHVDQAGARLQAGNPRCDNGTSDYRGVMSYCAQPDEWWGPDDRATLELYGYTD